MDALAWRAARTAVDVVRYQPRQLDLMLACSGDQPEVPAPVTRWLVDARTSPALRHGVDATAPPGSARGSGGGPLARSDGLGGGALELRRGRGGGGPCRRLDPPAPVPRPRASRACWCRIPHQVAVLALDMRGFSHLTRVLHDTQYLADLIGEYLTEMTEIIEAHRGVVFQYTGDGLLAIFLPELSGTDTARCSSASYARRVPRCTPASTRSNARWRADWKASGREGATIGLGIGLSFGRATVGLLGPSGKKQFGVIGEPVNQAAFLCSQAAAGSMLVERDAFVRAGGTIPPERVDAAALEEAPSTHRHDLASAGPRRDPLAAQAGEPSSFDLEPAADGAREAAEGLGVGEHGAVEEEYAPHFIGIDRRRRAGPGVDAEIRSEGGLIDAGIGHARIRLKSVVASSARVGSRQSQWPAKHPTVFRVSRKVVNTVPSAAVPDALHV